MLSKGPCDLRVLTVGPSPALVDRAANGQWVVTAGPDQGAVVSVGDRIAYPIHPMPEYQTVVIPE